MNLEKPLSEVSATEVIDRSFSLYSKRLLEFSVPFFFSGLLNGIIRQFTGFLLVQIIVPQKLTERFFEWLMSYLGAFVGAIFTLGMAFWIISTIVNGVSVKYASDLLEKGDASLTASFNFTINKLTSLLVSGLISGVLIILGFILFIVPGVIVAVMFSLTVPAIIIEDRGAFESLERSRRLVDKSWWKTFRVLLLVLFITILFSITGEAISIFFGPFRGVVSALVAAFIQPIHSLALTYLYYSMRVKEVEPAQPVSYKTPVPAVPLPTMPEQPRFCTYCGQDLPPDAVFCPNCGNRIKRYY